QTAGLASGSLFPIGTTTNTFLATDGSGNTSTCSFDVIVTDNEKPNVLTQNITVELDSNGLATITAAMINSGSTDNCTIESYSLDINSFDCSNIGTVEVTLTVNDVNGNSASKTAIVTVVDTLKPSLVTLSAISVNADADVCSYASSQLTAPAALDNCSVASVVASPASLALGANTVTWTVTDGSGNIETSTQIVTVVDSQIPTIATLDAISVNADSGVCTYESSQLTAPKAIDNCSVASVVASPASLVLGSNTVTWTVTDGSGLTETSIQIVTVVDSQNPTIATLNPISVNADSGVCTYASSQLTAPTPADNCSVASVLASPSSLDLGANTVTWTVTDGSGLTATSTQ
ncbi:MAG: HYR domain-containing protein, partial [Flavobacterium sp.]|nr:HYR domain-containing protein [Flavobacterium sp.]